MNIYTLYIKDYSGVPRYDMAESFIIVAPDETTARTLAETAGGDETKCGTEEKPFWFDPERTVCEILEVGSKAEIIIRSFNAG